MSESPPPLPPPVAGPGSRRGGWVACIVIAVSVGTGFVQAWRDKAAEAASGAGTELLKREIEARYLVGMNELVGRFVGTSAFDRREWLRPFEAAARSDEALMQLAILEGEIVGDEQARETLGRLSGGSPDLVEERAALDLLYQPGAAGSLTEDQARTLRERHGWLGGLAISHRLAGDDPERKQVMSGAVRTFLGTILLGVVCALALLAGVVLGGWGLVRFWTGRGRWGFAERERLLTLGAGSVWLETFAVYIGVMVLGGVVGDFLPQPWAPLPQVVAMFGAVVLGVIWPLLRGLPRAEHRAGFGWTRGRGWAREMAAGVVGYLAGLPFLVVGIALTLLLTFLTGADASHPINHMAGGSPVALVLIAVLAVAWAPFTEETFFRGAFFSAWRQRCGRWVSALATGLIFAAIHPQGWTAIPALGAIGLVLALIREWRGGLVASMTAHALNNGTLLGIMLLVMR